MNYKEKNIQIWVEDMESYKLLDSGEKEKLEEINGQKIVRAEPRAWWNKKIESSKYSVVKEEQKKGFETIINIGIGNIKAKIKFKNTSKHIGIFPEQFSEWKWIKEKIASSNHLVAREISVLNLFGYTGIASLVAASAGLPREAGAKWGAKVTHVDASKQSVEWARENQKLSGLENTPIRWIVDDVLKFIKKEAKQGKRYDAIIMDPPQFGKGPKGEVWKIEEKLPELLSVCREILSNEPLFIIFNMYSTELSSISVANLLSDMTKNLDGIVESGELAIKQKNFYSDRNVGAERLLPMSIFALWNTK